MNSQNASQSLQSTLSEANRSHVLHYLHCHGISSRASIAQTFGCPRRRLRKSPPRLIDAGIIHEVGGIEGARTAGPSAWNSIPSSSTSSASSCTQPRRNRHVRPQRPMLALTDLPTVKTTRFPTPSAPSTRPSTPCSPTTPQSSPSALAVPDHTCATKAEPPSSPPCKGGVPSTSLTSSPTRSAYRCSSSRMPAPACSPNTFDRQGSCRNLAYYLLGEGIGLGVIDDGRLINGAQGAATEIGHVSIDVNGLPCDCGNRGCLERYCSAVAIHDKLIETGIIAGADQMTYKRACHALFEQASQGDTAAQTLVREMDGTSATVASRFSMRSTPNALFSAISSPKVDSLCWTPHAKSSTRVIPNSTRRPTSA